MEGSGEFAGAVRGKKTRAGSVPAQTPGLEETLKFVERSNAICVDLGKMANFRAVMKGGEVFIRAELGAFNPRTWTWDVFGQRLVELERLWEEWLECRKRGKPFKEPQNSPLTRPGDDLIGTAEADLNSIVGKEQPEVLTVVDVFHNVASHISVKVDTDDMGMYRVAFMGEGKWVRYKAAPDEPVTVVHLGGCMEATHMKLEGIVKIEVWTDAIESFGVWGGEKKSKKNPLVGGGGGTGIGSESRSSPSARQRCVVCGRYGRKGEIRKSGYKCTECIGIPSAVDKHQQTPHETHQPIRLISSLVIGDPDIARQLLVPSLPGHAS